MATNGVCVIKSEFILPDHERQISLECISNEDNASIEDSTENAEGINDNDDEIQEPCYKKQKLSKREKKKLRGQNKARPLPFKRDITLELCKVLTNVAENEEPKNCQNERCHFLHDAQEYLKMKPADIKMDWSNEQTLLFIELYEKMPVLWDAKHPDHKNRVKLNEAWVNLQKQFDESISIVDLKKKKESLMASYRPLRKKVVESEEAGSGTDDVFKPTWYAFEAIDRFLRAKGEKNPAINSEDDWTKETHDEEIEYNTKYLLDEPPVSASRGNRQVSSNTFMRPQGVKQFITKDSHKRRRELPSQSDVAIVNSLKEASKALITLSSRQPQQEDQCSIFGQLVAEQLRQLSIKNRILAQRKVSNFLWQAMLDELEHQPSTLHSQSPAYSSTSTISSV